MKIFIEKEEKYFLLTDELEKDNIENNYIKEELINNVMDKLEEIKMSMEIAKQKRGGYLVKKLGVYPNFGK